MEYPQATTNIMLIWARNNNPLNLSHSNLNTHSFYMILHYQSTLATANLECPTFQPSTGRELAGKGLECPTIDRRHLWLDMGRS